MYLVQSSVGSKFIPWWKMPSRLKQRTRQYGRKKGAGQFKGRKDRLRTQNLELEQKVQAEKCKLEEKKTELDRENQADGRRFDSDFLSFLHFPLLLPLLY